MKTLKSILLLLLVFVIGFSIYVAVQPNSYSFSRSRTIEAPVSLLYDKVNDFKNWPSFSPWIEQDEDAIINFAKNTVGEGANYSWKGDVLGEGEMRTIAVNENTQITQQIEFKAPFEGQSDINWYFEPTAEGTKVTWAMEGKQDFVSKFFTTVMGSIESETGPNFERGLFKLDSIVKAEMKVYTINVEGITQHSGGYYLYNSTSSKFSEFQKNMTTMLPKIGAYATTHNVTMAGPPFVIYHKWDEENDTVLFSCCVPTNSKITTDDPDVLTGQLDSFKCVKTTLKGDYTNLKEAWESTMTYISENNLQMVATGTMLETYVTDAMAQPNPAEWITEIYVEIE